MAGAHYLQRSTRQPLLHTDRPFYLGVHFRYIRHDNRYMYSVFGYTEVAMECTMVGLAVQRPAIQESAAARIRRTLEDDINQGVCLPGDLLDEAMLSKRYKVSRTPVRDALLQLAAQGLVNVVPRSGTYVARMSIQELLAMLEALSEVEGSCAKLAAKRMSTEVRHKLQVCHAEARHAVEKQDPVAYVQYNADFHSLIWEGCLNPYLVQQVRYMRKRTQIYRRTVFQEPGRIVQSYAEHGQTLEAILHGDSDGASRTMLSHISGSSKDFLKLLSLSSAPLLDSHAEANPESRRR
jgi:DNA-binding GntR family transcriptional regulator